MERRCRAEEAELTEAFLADLQKGASRDLEALRRYEAEATSRHGEAEGYRTARLMLTARKWDVSVPPPPRPGGTNDKWEPHPSVARFGGWQLKEAVTCEIRRTIRKERRETFVFWFNSIFGFLGLVIGLVSVLRGKR
jgi:hypothetical protein